MTQTSLVRTGPEQVTRNGRAWGVIGLEALTAIAAGYGGFELSWDDAVGMPDDWLAGTPFRSWVIPGLLLLLVVGLPMAVAALLELRRSAWADAASVVAGAALIGWIAGELLIMRKYAVLQPVMLLVGLAVLLLAVRDRRHRPLLPSPGRRALSPARGTAAGRRLLGPAAVSPGRGRGCDRGPAKRGLRSS